MRLTDKNSDIGWNNKYYVKPSLFSENGVKAIDKLGQLEDIEDELGIDLITLFKALKQEWIYRKDYFPDRIVKCSPRGIKKDGLRVLDEDEYYLEDTITLEYEEFGKTWALTKEELEK